jgi:sarcosine oxidase subunit alpha
MREELGREPVIERGDPVELLVDGEPVRAYLGETIAGALVAAGHRVFRHAPRTGAPRGVYCGIGACFECVVTVEGLGQVRSCMVAVQPGMRVSLGRPAPAGEASGATD